jgi:hypothetical protein
MTLDDQVLAYLQIVPQAGATQIAADMQAIGNRAATAAEVRNALEPLAASGAVVRAGAVWREAGRPDGGGARF